MANLKKKQTNMGFLFFFSQKVKIKSNVLKKEKDKREWRRGRLPVRNPPMESRPYISFEEY